MGSNKGDFMEEFYLFPPDSRMSPSLCYDGINNKNNNKMNDKISGVSVEMEISKKFEPLNGLWNVRFDKEIIQKIEHPYFNFIASDMNVAVSKVSFIINNNHPVDYFCSVKFKTVI